MEATPSARFGKLCALAPGPAEMATSRRQDDWLDRHQRRFAAGHDEESWPRSHAALARVTVVVALLLLLVAALLIVADASARHRTEPAHPEGR